MAETLLQFQTPVAAPDGTSYRARACGSPMEGGPQWQGWIEFEPVDGSNQPLRSARETTQPNYADAAYWATGLTQVYLEGALARALKPLAITPALSADRPIFEGPAPSSVAATGAQEPATRSVLDPFSVYEKGEAMLRKQLGALSAWHLVNIAIDYELTTQRRDALSALPGPALVDLIVEGVRVETGSRVARNK